ncbi:hypothetical protein Nepgr_019981 [Nepenthes gracilis]|uniref:Uncharacterized protein n=1 Tax=Nepenthes gracilis TaxID=150966 RepID=A0AAD3SUG5_NEPGR|nr:hypothetical protein Nepgr_019981 [Nepenthes gracilis]
MRDCMRKLALWYTRTFKPIMTHEELEPIMATLGFEGRVPKPAPNGVVWKEYVYSAGGSRTRGGGGRGEAQQQQPTPRPRPRLPYQRIDGLHIYTYRAFIDAVNFYLEMGDISDLFHVRGMPLHPTHDRNKKLRRMDEDGSVFVYREGTLDHATLSLYHGNHDDDSNDRSSLIIRKKGSHLSVGNVVPLKDIID